MSLNAPSGPDPLDPQAGVRDIGVEVTPTRIRAGVFGPGYRLLGKTKLTTKLERGSQAVIQRISRCILDAADECDLSIRQIRRVVVGIPGEIDNRTGIAESVPELGWTAPVPLQAGLEQQLSVPVKVANLYDVSAVGIQHLELNPAPQSLAVIFIGRPFHVAVLRSGNWVPQPELTSFLELDPKPPVEAPSGDYQHFRARDFRKALRLGDQGVRNYLLQISGLAANWAAQVESSFRPDTIVFSGGAIDEIEKDALEHIQEQLRSLPQRLATTRLLISALGQNTGILGAAVSAAQQIPMNAPVPAMAP